MAIISKATNRIDIVVRADYGNMENTQNSSTSPKEEQDEKEQSPTRKSRAIRTLTTHALSSSITIAFQGANYAVGGSGIYTGDESFQNYQQRQIEIVQDVQNVASSVGLNAMYGLIYSGGNPLIGSINAGLGAMTSLTSKYVKYAARHREYNYKVFKENNAIEYNRSRANINLTNGRLR